MTRIDSFRPGQIPSRGEDRRTPRDRESIDDTDWDEIARLYDELLLVAPTPIVALNRGVAVGMARGPDAGLRALDELDDQTLAGYPWLAAARADINVASGECPRRRFVPTSTRGRDQRGGPALPLTPAS